MPCIHDLVKDQNTYRANVSQTVLEVAHAMVERNIGAVPVVHEDRLVGVFSERDLMRRVVVEGRDPARTRIGEVMTADPLTVEPTADLETCRYLMRRHGFRHLPVCQRQQVFGMVSMRDILLHDLSEKDDEVRMMRAYIHSTPYARLARFSDFLGVSVQRGFPPYPPPGDRQHQLGPLSSHFRQDFML